MSYEIFISHSTKDKIAADAVVAHLERAGLRCWCAPRDIRPGSSWAKSIVDAIGECKAMVVVFSSHANGSDHIRREVEAAVRHGIAVVPLRIEDVLPQGDLEYFLSSSHWMDAISAPVERHFDQLADQLRALTQPGQAAPTVSHAASPVRASAKTKRGKTAILGATVAAVLVIGGSVALWMHERGASTPTVSTLTLSNPTVSNPPVSNPPIYNPAVSNPPVSNTSVPNTPVHDATPVDAVKPSVVDVTPVMPAKPAETTPVTPVIASAPTNPQPTESKAVVAPDPSIAQDNRQWQAEAVVHFDNSYVLNNGRKRYAAWRKAADTGDPAAQFFVGCCYAQGAGVTEDATAAMDWFTQSANAGNTDAMTEMANRYGAGLGTDVSPQQWFLWMNKAANAGNPYAMGFLGGGLSLLPDPSMKSEGKRWIEKAAAGGSLDAQVYSACNAGMNIPDLTARLETLASKGQPDAVLLIANAHPTDPAHLAMAKKAIATYGKAVAIQSLIDPPPMFTFNSSGAFTQMAWQRLHEMAAGGYVDAQKAMDTLKAKHFADLSSR